ncbi:Short-chain dehydrogenase [Arachidicoccus rhizosphaerae]|jgi:short-subunit dehydrogenase|uniref:Short-chain dehydrogenase n=1 Tax=Arachidicoccus rhizosphaerae TaxID=551991 RepID=A0A1H3ZP38_9BACT|nr:SDR family oxidoreductase [Arachidicoccus rhizosphaerae]SEA25181.1 Short-chain dehydrogenase [Arachidicoccus rhizosphaerae]
MQIVVTGATRGIGKAVAAIFAKDRTAHHFFLCARKTEELDALKSLLMQTGEGTAHQVTTVRCDFLKNEDIQHFADAVLATGLPVDILVNNAGIYQPGSCYNEPEGQLEKMLQVNLMSAYHLTRALVPAMIQAKKGHIFNLCSIASIQAYANGGSYSISKFALSGFTRNLREELKPLGIKVTGIYPGATLSSSWDGLDIDPGRIMEVDDVAKMIYAAAYLSPQAVVEDIILRPQLGDL